MEYKLHVFMLLCNKDAKKCNVDELIMLMLPWIENDNLTAFQPTLSMLRINKQFIPRISPHATNIQGLQNANHVQLSTPFQYLLKCKKFEVFRKHVESNENFDFPHLLLYAVMQQCKEDTAFVEWALSKVELNLEDNPKLFTWLNKYSSPKIFELVNRGFDGELLQKEIDHFDNLPEERKYETLLNDLIVEKNYTIIQTIKSCATQEQWEYLVNLRKPYCQIGRVNAE